MGHLIVGVNLQYMVSASVSCFSWSVKGFTCWVAWSTNWSKNATQGMHCVTLWTTGINPGCQWHHVRINFHRDFISKIGKSWAVLIFTNMLWALYSDRLSSKFHSYKLHQDRHPKSLIRLRICPPEPIKRERKKKEEKKKKEQWAGFELGSSDSQSVSLTTSMGARSHRTDCTQTRIHTCTFLWRARKVGGNSRGFCTLVGEDGWVEWRLFHSSSSLGTRQV